jgi:hypothetical protein
MLWWSQVQKLDGVAWSTAELQSARWRSFGPPEALYRSALPDAARSIAKALNLELAQTSMTVRSNTRWVELADDGWVVRNRSGVPITKPFRHRGQAEVLANLTGSFVKSECTRAVVGRFSNDQSYSAVWRGHGGLLASARFAVCEMWRR